MQFTSDTMLIPNGVILLWTGAHATIPSAWERETTLDDKFTKGWGVSNPNDTGGATTHTHTSPTHTHQLASHTHTFVLGADPATGDGRQEGSASRLDQHQHTGTTSSMSGGVSGATGVTYGACSNDPPYRKVIFIKPTVSASLAQNIVSLWNANDPPVNWSTVTELQGRYLKGAGTGADADLTTDSGSTTNTHNIDHTHTAGSHSHTGTSSQGDQTMQGVNHSGNYDVTAGSHVHVVTLTSQAVSIPAYTGDLVTTETVEPAYSKLQAIKMGANGIAQVGMIGLWLGNVANIPRGWVLMDGTNGTKDMRDYFIKIGNPADANGGANTHTHGAQSHTHGASSSHTHTGTHANGEANDPQTDAYPRHVSPVGHVHPVQGVQTVTASYGASNTTADSADNQPAYRVVAYIQLNKIYRNLGRIIDA